MSTNCPVRVNPSLSVRHRLRFVALTCLLAVIAAACGGGDTATEAVAMGPNAVFNSSSSLSDPPTVWEGSLLGLVKTGTSSFNSESGTCLVLLGVTTATNGPAGNAPNGMLMRSIVVRVGGELIYPDDNKCDTQAVRDAGYDWLINMDAPLGTEFPFFEEFFVPGIDNATPEMVLYGADTAGLPSTPFKPTILSSIPVPPA